MQEMCPSIELHPLPQHRMLMPQRDRSFRSVSPEDMKYPFSSSTQITGLRRGNSSLSPLRPLSGVQSSVLLSAYCILSLCDSLLALCQDHLDVARIAHVGVDTTVGTVCAAALLWCLVDLDVLDDKVGSIKTLDIGVGFGVLEQTEEKFG